MLVSCPLRMACIVSIPAIVHRAAQKDLKPSIGRVRRFTARWSWLNSAKGSLPPLVCRTVHAGFLAHGSSSRAALVISTIPLRTITTASMYLVVTVTMNRHQIPIRVVPALVVAVMHLQKRLWQEDESTMATPTVLVT